MDMRKKRHMSRIGKTFDGLRARKEKALIAYIMAGDPSLKRTGDLVMEMARSGADLIELGVPFSDPIADGPVIQRAGQRALKKKTTLRSTLGLVEALRKKTQVPLVAMSYFNPIFKFGIPRFFKEASRAGLDGVIIPDLPPEEGAEVERESRKRGVDWVLLAAPTTPNPRQRILARRTRGFLYYVSITGITGASLKNFSEIHRNVSHIKKRSRVPVAVGFGVSNPRNAARLAAMGDGVIVGSAIVRLIEKKGKHPRLPSLVGKFVRELNAAVKK